MLQVFNQWSNAEPYLTYKPGHVGGLDALRVGAYNLYEQIYWTIPEAFKLTQRGSDDNPIYIPSAKQIVETLHRYLAPGFNVVVDPSMGTTSEQEEAMRLWNDLARRERFHSRFSSNKRYGIIRGDWMWRIMADPDRPQGSRLSVLPVDPASYFPVTSPDDVDTIIGVDLAWMEEVEGKELIRKVMYRKTTGTGGPSPITVSEALFEPDRSGLPGKDEGSPVEETQAETPLPSPIDQIPIYHIQHFDEPGAPYGSSEIRGMERIAGAINQSVSDEDLALAMEGLGVYWSDGGPPVDEETGEEVPWDLGPARVVEVATGKQFGRVQGIQSVTPMLDHRKYLHDQMDATAAISAIAKGKVDVQVAESGIALLLEMGPLLAHAGEKEQIITDVSVNFLFDLRKWFAAYEGVGTALDNIIWVPRYGDKLPPNRKQKFDEIMALLGIDPPVVSRKWARGELKKLGYEFPEEAQILAEIIAEQTAFKQLEADVLGARADADAEDEGAPETNGQVTSGTAPVE